MVDKDEKYDTCKCGFNPAINKDKFEIQTWEYGMGDKIVISQSDAKCKNCDDKFKIEISW